MHPLERQVVISQYLNNCKGYTHTRDGRFIWHAFLELHKAGMEIPPPFLDKLADIGKKLLKARGDSEIARAIEFKGDESRHIGPKLSYRTYEKWYRASEVFILMEQYNISVTQAIVEAAKQYRMTPNKMRHYFYETFPGGKPFPPEGGRPGQSSKSRIKPKPEVAWNNMPWTRSTKY